jgi:ribonuclease HI
MQLANNFDIVQYQQTRLSPGEDFYLKSRLPAHSFFYNNYSAAAAGTLMIVGPKLIKEYTIEHKVIQQGYIQALYFTSRKEGGPGFVVVNAYLYTGDLQNTRSWPSRQVKKYCRFNGKTYALSVHVRRAYQLSLISKAIKHTRYVFFAGDLNFHTASDDSSNKTKCNHALFLHHWHAFLASHKLKELYQPTKTYFCISKTDPANSHCTRIDRIYCSYDEADYAIVKPTVYTPRIPFSIPASYSRAFSQGGEQGSPPRLHNSSDHIPVGVYFTEPIKAKKKPSLPRFIIDNPTYQEELTKAWLNRPVGSDPYREHEELIKLAMRTARRFRRLPAKCQNHAVYQLSTTITVLRAVSHHDTSRPAMLNMQKRFPEAFAQLNYNAKTNYYDTSALRRQYKQILEKAVEEESKQTATPKTNLVKQIKARVGSERAYITRLREKEEEIGTEDPDEIAQIEQRFYQHLWSQRDADTRHIESLLMHYAKRITKPIKKPNAKLVAEVLATLNESCPGPDGIPPVFYKTFSKLITPIILATLNKLMLEETPPENFNWGTLFCLPKEIRDLITETRPITVPNVVNRLCSKTLYACIQPATNGFLNDAQHACKGKRIGVPIKHVNKSFYRKAREQVLELLLLLDFRKAFDKVLHEFVHRLLEHIGLPQWLRNAIRNLLHNLGAFTSVRGAREFFIRVFNGVKQGCPLSPLIFCIIMDPLLHFLRSPPLLFRPLGSGLDAMGFCDDIEAPLYNKKDLTFFITVTRYFIKASGFEVNFKKTVLLPNLPMVDIEDKLAPFREYLRTLRGWENVKFVKTARYLGILFGHGLTCEEQFAKPLEDLQRRAKKYKRVVSRFAVHKRIVTCNTWLLSILSFKHNFFMIPPSVAQSVESICAKLIIPWNTFSVDLLYNKPKFCNFNQPLREFNYANLAALASQYSEELEADVYRATGTGPEVSVFINQYCNPRYPFSAEGAWSTNIIEEHIFLAFHYIQTEYEIKLEYNTPAKQIYAKLMGSQFHTIRSQAPITNMLKRYEAQDCTQTVVANFGLIDRKLGEHSRFDQIRIIANGVATSRRLAPLHRNNTEHIPHLGLNLPCFFCGQDIDSNEHFLLSEDCIVIATARREVVLQHTGQVFYSSAKHAALLLEPYTKEQVNLLTAFNRSVLLTRQQLVSGVKFRFLKATIISQTKALLNRLSPNGKKHEEEAKACVALVAQLQEQPGVIICFSDGSSFSNPGPAGAGAILQAHGNAPISKSVALGISTNNVAELWGYGMVLDTLNAWSRNPPAGLLCTEVHVFIDSRYVLDIFTNKSMPSEHLQIISRIWEKHNELTSRTKLALHWAPGHTGIELNELADIAAKKGAEDSNNNIGIEVEERLVFSHPFTHPPNANTKHLPQAHYLFHDYPP